MAKDSEILIPVGQQGEVINSDPRDDLESPDEQKDPKKAADEKLVAWVVDKVRLWKDHRNGNYEDAWNLYERTWRGIWTPEDKSKKKERTKLISPATAEAVENGVSEIEEAVFGRGEFFDMWPEAKDNETEREAARKNEVLFREDITKTKFTTQCSEVVLLAAVYGTGIGEIVLTKETEYDIVAEETAVTTTDPETGESTPAVGPDGQPQMRVEPRTIERVMERPVLRSVNPRNFIIDPSARGVQDALGCAIEEDVGAHIINEGIKNGDYNDIEVEISSGDTRQKPDPQVENPWVHDVVSVIRYYGKVPRNLLFPPDVMTDLEVADEDESLVETDLVEAWVFIANEEQLLKAVETPDMMRDRPVVVYQWDVVPGRFWGRGICEKGAVPQRLLDAELRARVDALAFAAAPMMAMDATKLPRGFKLDVYPGKNLLVAGDPTQVLKPFKFGELDQNSAAQVQLFDTMVQRATGSVDSTTMAQQGVSGQARTGAVSMSMAGVVKRNKRMLTRYVNDFLAPTLMKLMWRYIQYDQERYIPLNPTFNMPSTMGIMQREYETQNLTQIMNTMQPGTSEHLMLLMGVVANSGIPSRDKIMKLLQRRLEQVMQTEAAPPQEEQQPQEMVDPVQIELARQDAMLNLQLKQLELAKVQAETRKLNAEARDKELEPMLEAREQSLRGIYQTSQDKINAEFDRRMAVADMFIKEKGIDSRERIADKQIIAARANEPKPAVSNRGK
jgi:hypothetical protein